ncbi:hypothetical protein SAMN04488577_2215 [Bacillus sp. cl95]|nr:hypothetical protein SAMN02799634_10296 [Bacillus sp. UNCCL13]SFQ83595.1 hypothetical protein SAMN04488577_2215 [Bacillus sp. cl95]
MNFLKLVVTLIFSINILSGCGSEKIESLKMNINFFIYKV